MILPDGSNWLPASHRPHFFPERSRDEKDKRIPLHNNATGNRTYCHSCILHRQGITIGTNPNPQTRKEPTMTKRILSYIYSPICFATALLVALGIITASGLSSEGIERIFPEKYCWAYLATGLVLAIIVIIIANKGWAKPTGREETPWWKTVIATVVIASLAAAGMWKCTESNWATAITPFVVVLISIAKAASDRWRQPTVDAEQPQKSQSTRKQDIMQLGNHE